MGCENGCGGCGGNCGGHGGGCGGNCGGRGKIKPCPCKLEAWLKRLRTQSQVLARDFFAVCGDFHFTEDEQMKMLGLDKEGLQNLRLAQVGDAIPPDDVLWRIFNLCQGAEILSQYLEWNALACATWFRSRHMLHESAMKDLVSEEIWKKGLVPMELMCSDPDGIVKVVVYIALISDQKGG